MKYLKLVPVYIMLVAFALPSLAARQLTGNMMVLSRAMSLNEVSNEAGIIFKGSLLSQSEELDEQSGLRVRKLNFAISDAIKGLDENKKEISLKEWASARTPFLGKVNINEEYVFFFNTPHELTGLSSLTGIEQGLTSFDASGKPVLHTWIDLQQQKAASHKLGLVNKASLTVDANPQSYMELKKLCQQYMNNGSVSHE